MKLLARFGARASSRAKAAPLHEESSQRALLRVVWLGSRSAGKSAATQALLMDPEESKQIDGALRWEPNSYVPVYENSDYPGGTGISVVRLWGELRAHGREWNLELSDTLGGLLLQESSPDPAKPDRPEEYPELYKASRKADLLILALPPDDLAGDARERIFRHLLSHVGKALCNQRRLMVAVAYTKADEYAFASPPPPRVLSRRAHFRALRRLRQRGEDAWRQFLDSVEPPSSPYDDAAARREALERSAELWRQLASMLPERSCHLNGYWIAARQPDSPLSGWDQRALGELLADFVRHLRHIESRPPIRRRSLAVSGVAALTLLASGWCSYTLGSELAAAPSDVPVERIESPRRTPLLRDELALLGAARKLESAVKRATAQPIAPVELSDRGAHNEPEVKLARDYLRASTGAAAKCVESIDALMQREGEWAFLPGAEPPPELVGRWQRVGDVLRAFAAVLDDERDSVPRGELFEALRGACRATVTERCDALLADFGRELHQLLRLAAVDLRGQEWLPCDPYSLDDLVRMHGGSAVNACADATVRLRTQAMPSERHKAVRLVLTNQGGGMMLSFKPDTSVQVEDTADSVRRDMPEELSLPACWERIVIHVDADSDAGAWAKFEVRSGSSTRTPGAHDHLYLRAVLEALSDPIAGQRDPALELVPIEGGEALDETLERSIGAALARLWPK